jgi:hypothetical protein
VANRAREALGSFISPQENLAVGVSKIWIYPGPRPDMSGHHLWNPDAKPDIAERPDMSGQSLWNLVAKPIRLRGRTCLARVSRIRLGG